MSNQLKKQSSPYLLQHAENPVDWYPWGKQAFEKAGKEDKPIFLSIGYSTCHWCHVMAQESFENKEIADILNRYFISVKVDREERPDVDSVYMAFCQAFTGSGGWPMSIFMTAEQIPFFAGTYFPPETQFGRIGFRELLLRIVEKWKNNREGLLQTAKAIADDINREESITEEKPDENLPEFAVEMFFQRFDKKHGGFGAAPKFPMPHNLIFLMLYARLHQNKAALHQAEITLEKMRRGGIFDQIGYGFSRYSTDDCFLVPHFEKMLYDNALLIIAYSIAGKATGKKLFLDTARQTAEYIFREMTGKDGEFYSAQDADSEGEEGSFYVWDYDEVCNVLGGKRGKAFCEYFGVTREGNFEGKNILHLLNGNDISDKFQEEIEELYRYRKSRTKLQLDDKVLTSWNALMICAMAVLYRVTGEKSYLDAAERAECFLEEKLIRENILYVSFRNGEVSVKGFLDDYAYYTAALLCLYEVTSKARYLERAKKMSKEAEKQFFDGENGGYFLYGTKNSALISKPKETYDGALPSGNSVIALCLVRLAQITGSGRDRKKAEKQLAFLSVKALRYPMGYSMFLTALEIYLNPPEKIAVVLSEKDSREKIFSALPLYAEVRIYSHQTEHYQRLNGKTTYYVCRDYQCLPPSDSYQ